MAFSYSSLVGVLGSRLLTSEFWSGVMVSFIRLGFWGVVDDLCPGWPGRWQDARYCLPVIRQCSLIGMTRVSVANGERVRRATTSYISWKVSRSLLSIMEGGQTPNRVFD